MTGLHACAAMPAPSPLALDAPVSGHAAAPYGAGDVHGAVHPLTLEDGDYVEGTLESGSEAADLRLIDRQGRSLRLLLDGTAGRATFRFVAGPDSAALRVTLRSGEDYGLALTRRIAAADQAAAPRDHLSPTIAALAERLARGGGTEEFWRMVTERGSPLVEPLDSGGGMTGRSVMTFLARGARRNVRLLGGPSSNHERLERLGTSDVWFKSFVVPNSTRLSYQIAPDVPDFPGTCRECREAILAQLRADPLNRRPWPADAPDPYNQLSLVELPDAPPQPGIDETAVPAGRFIAERFASRILGNVRDVTVYLPPNVDPKDAGTHLLVLFDGPDYLGRRAPVPTMLDRLTGDGSLPPVMAVFIANPSAEARARELPANPAFAAMLADELLPWLGATTGIRPRPDRTVLAGSSYGGLAAVTAALARPERFGNALSLSGSFWWHPDDAPPERPEHVAGLVGSMARRPVRLFLAAGLFEGTIDGEIGILESTRHLRDVLEAKGYAVSHREYAAGHDHFAWRGALGDGLLALFGAEPGGTSSLKRDSVPR